MSKRDKVFLVYAVAIKKLTEEDLRKKFEKAKINHGKIWSESSNFEKYKSFLHDWGEDEYEFDKWISSIHLDKEDALEYVTKNIADINEAGCYNYAAILEAPCNVSYFETHVNKDTDITLFKYNHEKDIYEELDKTNPVYMPFLYNIWGMAYTPNVNKNLEEER